jgi:hypothetical protein
LEIDDDMRGLGRIELDLVMGPSHPGDAVGSFGRNVRVMHGWREPPMFVLARAVERFKWLFHL